VNSLRVALITAGALTALVAGAATASWGLGPLSASPNAAAPQIVAADASYVDATTTSAVQAASPSSDIAAPIEKTRVAYALPPSPPVDIDPDGPRPDSGPVASESAQPDPAGPNASLSGEASSDPPTATVGPGSHIDAEGDITAGASNAIAPGPD
jgi:hypothetical protein